MRRYRDHLLSEPEERILAEKALTGASAWARLFDELTSAIEVSLSEEEPVALDVALSRLVVPDREVRRTSAEAVTEALAPGLRTRAYLFNTLLVDKGIDDRLRRYPNWLAARNLANEVSDESVAALVEAVRARYELPRRWYRLKAQLLGIERLADYDRMAAVRPGTRSASRMQTRASWCSTATPRSHRSSARSPWHSSTELHRRSGASGQARRSLLRLGVPSVDPYVMLNYTSRRRDVLTLAHELGHGVHFALAAKQGIFHQGTPLTLAETASVFGETIVFGRLLDEDSSPASRLALLAENIEGAIATVFRQVAMNRFEELVHTRGASRASCRSSASASCGSRARRRCSGTRSRSPRAIARGGPTSRTSSARRATSTPTPTASCWRCRSTSAMSSAAGSWSALPGAAGRRRLALPAGARRDGRH